MTQKPIIGIIEDEENQQKLMASLLSPGLPFEVVFYNSGQEFLQSLENTVPDLVYIDLRLHDMTGIEVIEKTTLKFPKLAMVIQSSLPDEDSFFNALKAGAVGYHWKAETEQFVERNDIYLKGGSFLTPTMAFRISRHLKKNNIYNPEGLEKQVLEMMTKGYSADMIHDKEKLSHEEINSSVRKIFASLYQGREQV